MSRFIDRLSAITEGAAPMGFKIATTASRPKMLLVASLATPEGAAEYSAGADAVLFPFSEAGAATLQKAAKGLTDVPWGLESTEGRDSGKIAESGADFVVFPQGAPMAAFQGEGPGRIVAIEPALKDSLLRSIDRLPPDAALASFEKGPLTWRDLMEIQRCAALLTKPLLLRVPPDVTKPELQAMLTAGVGGVVVEIGTGQKGKVKEIKDMISALVEPLRKRAHPAALVPFVSGRAEAEEETEEDDEEEE